MGNQYGTTPFRRRRRGAVVVWIVGGLLVVGAISAAFMSYVKNQSNSDRVSERQLFRVGESSFDLTIPASGELEALNSIEIRNQLDFRAIIKQIIPEGSRVKKGDLLVQFSSDQIEDRIQQAELSVSSADNAATSAKQAVELQGSENQSSEEKAKVKVAIADLELKRWENGERITKETEMQLALDKATRNLDRFKRELKESETLLKQGFISQSDRDQDEINLLEGEAALKNAELALKTYHDYTIPKDEKQKQSDLAEAKAELERTIERNKNQLSQKMADRDSRMHQLELQRTGLKRLQNQLAMCKVTAPANGLVVYGTSVGGRWWRNDNQSLDIGQEVSPNQLLIILPDTEKMVASVKVHESQFNQIKKGMPAKIRVDALKDVVLDGTVENIGVMAEQSFGTQVREYTVKILINEENKWSLKPSMRCKADIFLGHVENSIAVPIEAVNIGKGTRFVWLSQGGDKYKKQKVSIGRASEMMIEIKKGLKTGDVVLLREPLPGEQQRS